MPFGSQLAAYLDMKELRVRYLPINLNCIVSFESIPIHTIGRPKTNGNHTDMLNGVRLLLADGSSFVAILDDRDRTFSDFLELARDSGKLVYEGFGQSNYVRHYVHGTT
ncbi:hypothetical protein [Paraburkholderia ultramafica]|nr:hypothetical protein [Paraburkholderia ultramafica]